MITDQIDNALILLTNCLLACLLIQYTIHLYINTPAHYQYPRNRIQGGLSSNSTPSTVAAAPDEAISSSNPRYAECPDDTRSASKEDDYYQADNKSVRKETDYMTLKADDVQRKKMESKLEGPESGLKKSVSGFAQPGPQTPNNDSHCNNKSNLNEDEQGMWKLCMI